MHLAKFNRDIPSPEWIKNVNYKGDYTEYSPSDYAIAINSKHKYDPVRMRELEYQRQRKGFGEEETNDLLVGQYSGAHPVGRKEVYFLKNKNRDSIPGSNGDRKIELLQPISNRQNSMLSSNPFERKSGEKQQIQRIPQDIYNPVTQEYVSIHNDDKNSLHKREIRTREWSLYHPKLPYNSIKGTTTHDSVGPLLTDDNHTMILESIKDNMNYDDSIHSSRSKGKSNRSEECNALIHGKIPPLDFNVCSNGSPRKPRDTYNRVLQRHYSDRDQTKEDTHNKIEMDKERQHAKMRAINYETNYDIVTLQHKLTGDIVQGESPTKKYRNHSDIFFKHSGEVKRSELHVLDRPPLRVRSRGRNPVMEGMRLALLPKKTTARNRNPILHGSRGKRMPKPPSKPREPWNVIIEEATSSFSVNGNKKNHGPLKPIVNESNDKTRTTAGARENTFSHNIISNDDRTSPAISIYSSSSNSSSRNECVDNLFPAPPLQRSNHSSSVRVRNSNLRTSRGKYLEPVNTLGQEYKYRPIPPRATAGEFHSHDRGMKSTEGMDSYRPPVAVSSTTSRGNRRPTGLLRGETTWRGV